MFAKAFGMAVDLLAQSGLPTFRHKPRLYCLGQLWVIDLRSEVKQMADKNKGVCPIMSFRSSFSKDAAVPCVAERCAFWDDLYGKCGQISQAERTADALRLIQDKLHDLMIKM